jgi:hypothetical protein
MKIWKKLRNEAGTPVLHIIDRKRDYVFPIWKFAKTAQTRLFFGYHTESRDVISFRIE